MRSLHNDVVLGTSVAILAALGCWTATGLGPDARVFPMLVLVPAVPIGILIAVRGQLRLLRGGDNPRFFTSPGRFLLVVGAMVLALLGVQHLGFLTTSALLIPLLSALLGYRRPVPVILTTALFIAMVHIVFVQVLSRPLPAEIWTRIGG